ncbi:hypothetical protein GCM10022631_42120 [Deinococcus rubellus]|uniref:Uncharacterized protein n=1 Tax=Deinococcus rubellus TaxID=1889240 RepID=A0ABY5YLN1_9DEIO|nr:hypothetical protein [Deinococcus rubellus]UWX65007.1 hypothetical protein N0D28_04935 [Deinococcus rubellus]
MKHTRFKVSFRLLSIGFGLLGAVQAQQTPAYSGPQAVVYIGDNYCSGGYCGYSAWSSFDSAITQALKASGYVRPVRQQDGANLIMKAGITDITGGGGVCLPIVGCLNAKTVKASFEIDDAKTGTVIWQDTCDGTSAGYSSWYWWSGVSFSSDESKAAADCAGKLVQKFNGSAAIKPYLTVAAGAPLGTAATVTTTVSSVTTTSNTPSSNAGSPSEAQSASMVQLLGGAMQALSFSDVNALFSSDPLNPVSVKALNAAATAQTLSDAARMKFSVTPGEDAGAYRLIGLSYTLPGGSEKFVQLAVAAEGPLNTRSGARIVYLSAFNPARTATPALDGLSKNVETLLADVRAALNLP